MSGVRGRAARILAFLTQRTAGRVLIAGTGLLVLIVAAVVVGGDDPAQTATGPGPTRRADVPATDPPTTTAAPTTTPPVVPDPEPGLRFLPDDDAPGGVAAPLTGLRVVDPGVLQRPALAVKVDNLDAPGSDARPQVGLARADVVVEEVVEGGITRFVAVLHSTGAPAVGPVRSARTTDVDLLPAFGVPVFAFSGANAGTASAVRASSSLIDLGGEWAPAYHRVGDRRRPHNLMARPDELWARGGGGVPPGPLATFLPLDRPVPAGEPAGVDLGFRGAAAAPVGWRWSEGDGRWLRSQRGSWHIDGEGFAVGPRNVVVLVTEYRSSSADPRSPEAITVGSGEALVLTRGVVVRGRWHRGSLGEGFTLLDGAGQPIPLTVGRTWIELAPPGIVTVVGP